MEPNIKCSNKKHAEIEAINYCPDCNLYLCNKCINTHSEFYENHKSYKLDKNINDLFTGKCKEMNHKLDLEFFCKTHNKLCCAACLSKIKGNQNGQHFDCNVCTIEEIKTEKENKLKENLKYLMEFSEKINNIKDELENIFEKITKNKDDLKMKISKIFTELRNALNTREDELLLEVDKIFKEKFFKEDIIKFGEKLPNKINSFLEKGKLLDKNWANKEKLMSNISECINIENNIKNIKDINQNIEKYNSKLIIKFSPEETEINKLIENFKSFGNFIEEIQDFKFKFKQCERYNISNNGLSATKTIDCWDYTLLGDKEIPKNKIIKWKIKLNSNVRNDYDDFYIGIGNESSKKINEFFSFYSGEGKIRLNNKGKDIVHNYPNQNLKKGDIIEVKVDRIKGNLSFAVNGVNLGISFSNIPKDDILYPIILLYERNLNVEII